MPPQEGKFILDVVGEGVCVQASTLGSLEALLEFLRSDAVRIPVSGINIGPVHKKDVMRASTMLEKGRKKFAVILAFDVLVTKEAQEQAQSTGVRIFTADIIYHLFDQFSAYLKHVSTTPFISHLSYYVLDLMSSSQSLQDTTGFMRQKDKLCSIAIQNWLVYHSRIPIALVSRRIVSSWDIY